MELLEAEGRELRRASARLGWGLGLIALSILLAAVAAGLCLWSLYAYIHATAGTVAAGLVTGLASIALAVLSGWAARRMSR